MALLSRLRACAGERETKTTTRTNAARKRAVYNGRMSKGDLRAKSAQICGVQSNFPRLLCGGSELGDILHVNKGDQGRQYDKNDESRSRVNAPRATYRAKLCLPRSTPEPVRLMGHLLHALGGKRHPDETGYDADTDLTGSSKALARARFRKRKLLGYIKACVLELRRVLVIQLDDLFDVLQQ